MFGIQRVDRLSDRFFLETTFVWLSLWAASLKLDRLLTNKWWDDDDDDDGGDRNTIDQLVPRECE